MSGDRYRRRRAVGDDLDYLVEQRECIGNSTRCWNAQILHGARQPPMQIPGDNVPGVKPRSLALRLGARIAGQAADFVPAALPQLASTVSCVFAVLIVVDKHMAATPMADTSADRLSGTIRTDRCFSEIAGREPVRSSSRDKCGCENPLAAVQHGRSRLRSSSLSD